MRRRRPAATPPMRFVLATSLGVSLCLVLATAVPMAVESGHEVRALWVTRSAMTSLSSVATMVRAANSAGFNALFVQVRGRGDAFYASRYEPRADGLAAQPESFDPLEETIAAAHELGLEVHAWVNVNLVSSATELPASRDHIVYRHPEWLMVPRALAAELATMDPSNPAYLGKLARWTRASSQEVEGLYASPIQLGMAEHTVSVVTDLVSKYRLDGVHLDYLRYPDDEFDYSRRALAEFRKEIATDLLPADLQRLDAREAVDPTVFADTFPERWARFRTSRLTSLLMRIRSAVKRERPDIVVSAAVVADLRDATTRRLQDWRTWLEGGLLDAVCPLAYSADPELFARQIADARAIVGSHSVWAGIGAYRLTATQTIDNIQAARRLGADGIALFSYDNLTNLAQHQLDYLSVVARAAFNQTGPALSR